MTNKHRATGAEGEDKAVKSDNPVRKKEKNERMKKRKEERAKERNSKRKKKEQKVRKLKTSGKIKLEAGRNRFKLDVRRDIAEYQDSTRADKLIRTMFCQV
jgi:hypothetical protein